MTQQPYVLLVTGPAGAGKTAVAELWAQARPYPTAHISLDDVRDWLKSGRVDPAAGWCDEAERQYARARAICAAAARSYYSDTISCVIDDAVFPDWPEVSVERWVADLGLRDIRLAVLLPSFEVISLRNQHRSGDRRLDPEMLRIIYDRMTGWARTDVPVIDNTALSPEETAASLAAIVESGRAAVGQRLTEHS